MAKGSYQVKVAKLAGNKYTDVASLSLSVTGDGWKVAPTCAAAKPKPKKDGKKKGVKKPKFRLPKRKSGK